MVCLQLVVYPFFGFLFTSSLPVIRKGQENRRDKADRLRKWKPLSRPVPRRHYLVLPSHTQHTATDMNMYPDQIAQDTSPPRPRFMAHWKPSHIVPRSRNLPRTGSNRHAKQTPPKPKVYAGHVGTERAGTLDDGRPQEKDKGPTRSVQYQHTLQHTLMR